MTFYLKLLKKTFKEWFHDDVSIYAGSISYLTIFSIGPLVTILIWVLGLFLEEEAITGQIYNLLSEMVNPNVAEMVQNLVVNSGEHRNQGMWATIIGVVITLYSATLIVVQMKDVLDKMWRIPQEKDTTKLWKKYVIGVAGVFGVGVILLISGLMNAVVYVISNSLFTILPFTKFIIAAANNFVVFISLSIFIAGMFKYLPNLHLRWSAVVPGAVFTTTLFFIGKLIFGRYMATQVLDSTFGAATSLVAFIMWVYFSAHILFLGAEFTKVYAEEKKLIIGKSKAHPKTA